MRSIEKEFVIVQEFLTNQLNESISKNEISKYAFNDSGPICVLMYI